MLYDIRSKASKSSIDPKDDAKTYVDFTKDDAENDKKVEVDKAQLSNMNTEANDSTSKKVQTMPSVAKLSATKLTNGKSPYKIRREAK